ncbi:hypothetical protein [Arthrobacter sp. HLT1-21]
MHAGRQVGAWVLELGNSELDEVVGSAGPVHKEGLVLCASGAHEDFLEVVPDPFGAFETCAAGEEFVKCAVVEVRLRRQSDERGACSGHPILESPTCEEPDIVPTVNEARGDREHRCDVAD